MDKYISPNRCFDAREFSEFGNNKYNRASFCVVIREYLYTNKTNNFNFYQCRNAIIDKFNDFCLINQKDCSNKTFNWSCNENVIKENLLLENQDILELDLFDSSSGSQITLDVYKELTPLICALEKLSKAKKYDDILVTNYLNAFLDVSAKIIFNKDNVKLNSLLFRRSKTVDNLNCLGRIPFKEKEQKERGCSYFNIYSPFVCDAVMRTFYDISLNRKRLYIESESDMIRQLRYEICLKQIERTFTRFTSYNNGTTYRATLNRHQGEIISVRYNDLSSLEDIKPLRLFEKIVAYIKREVLKLKNNETYHIEQSKKIININILVIGHTEMSVNYDLSKSDEKYKDERELCDLLNFLLCWYNRCFDDEFPKLNILIDNYVNEYDAPYAEDAFSQKRFNIERNLNGNYGKVNIFSCQYINEFYFTYSNLDKLCESHDIIFILDCPWLSVESFEIKNNGLLKYFCQDFANRKLRNKEKDILDRHVKTDMQRLDTQYNRITSSDTDKAGDIARLFFDGLLRKIQKSAQTSHGDEEKEIFIFTSETDGIKYSLLETYPLTRTELYGGKQFTIARFTNKKSECLPFNNEPICIKIRFWSLLKYNSISFAIDNMTKILSKFFNIKEPENYFEIMRDIIIVLNVANNLRDINISVRFSDRINKVMEEMDISLTEFEIIKPKLHKVIFDFVKELYDNVVFSDYDNFGDSIIRTAFTMNIYSSANNVSDMLFLYFYEKAKNNSSISKCFNIFWDSNCDTFESEAPLLHNVEYFSDKKLYSILFETLSLNDEIRIGTKAILASAGEYFNCDISIEQNILRNILLLCEKHELVGSELYNNAKNALNKIDLL